MTLQGDMEAYGIRGIHDFAAKFPLLSGEELDDLAADIRANGLRNALWVTPDGLLLDGRNRFLACGKAGVEPRFETVEGNPVALIVSANAIRRQLSAGQRAMAVAVGMRERGLWDEDAGRWKREALKSSPNGDKRPKGEVNDLGYAGTVLAYSQALADEVLLGTKNLRATYDEVQRARREAERREREHEELRVKAPDLLARLDDDFTHEMIWAAYQERDKARLQEEHDLAEAKRTYASNIWVAVQHLSGHVASDARKELFATLDIGDDIALEDVTDAIATLQLLAKRLKGRGK